MLVHTHVVDEHLRQEIHDIEVGLLLVRYEGLVSDELKLQRKCTYGILMPKFKIGYKPRAYQGICFWIPVVRSHGCCSHPRRLLPHDLPCDDSVFRRGRLCPIFETHGSGYLPGSMKHVVGELH